MSRASEEETWSDDEDISWKVRRAAARAVAAVITHFPDLLPEVRGVGGWVRGWWATERAEWVGVGGGVSPPSSLSRGATFPATNHHHAHSTPTPKQIYPKVAPVLVQRFREREETVKQDVFQVGGWEVGGGRRRWQVDGCMGAGHARQAVC